MWNSYLGKRILGFKFAFKGVWLLLKKEPSIQVQAIIALVLTIAGFYFDLSTTEWMFQLFAIGLVLGLEGLNTAVEELSDFIHPDYHAKIGYIKDIAAGAVFFAALAAFIIGCLIYIPKF